jgi:hypothetical protein
MEQPDREIPIIISKKPSFTEKWYEGHVEYNGEEHKFWLVDPSDSEYEIDVRWFFKNVPREIRGMRHLIIEAFKQKINEKDNSTG